MAMEKHLFNLKFAAKQLERDSKKCDKEEKAEKLKQSLPPGLQVKELKWKKRSLNDTNKLLFK